MQQQQLEPTPFALIQRSAKGNVIEAVEFVIESVSRPMEFGEGTLQICECVDGAGTKMTVAFMDKEEISRDSVGHWLRCLATPGTGQKSNSLFGVQVGEYKNKKRVEVKAKAEMEWLTGGGPPPPRQQQPPQRTQQYSQPPPQQRQQQPQRTQQYSQQPPQHQPQPQQQYRQQPPQHQPPQNDLGYIRGIVAKATLLRCLRFDDSVKMAASAQKRHGITMTLEQVRATATSTFIEIVRRVEWDRIPILDMMTLPIPRIPASSILSCPEPSLTQPHYMHDQAQHDHAQFSPPPQQPPTQQDNYSEEPINDGLDGDDIPF